MGSRRGLSNTTIILLIPVVLVAGFVLLKAGGALLDVYGFKKDLEMNVEQVDYSCVAEDCEDQLVEELEDLRQLKGRDIQLDYDELDWLGVDNELRVCGWKTVDFKVWKYYYYFCYNIPVYI